MSCRVASDEGGTDLDLALFSSVVDAEDLGGEKLFSFVRDSPYVSGAASRRRGAITSPEQPPAEVMRFR